MKYFVILYLISFPIFFFLSADAFIIYFSINFIIIGIFSRLLYRYIMAKYFGSRFIE